MNIRERSRGIKSVLWWILAANIFVAILKLIYGYTIGSLSMRADGIHSLADSAANIVGIVGMIFASKPADKEHPYGHQKIEILASWGIGALILFGMFQMVKDIFEQGPHATIGEVGVGGFGVVFGTLLINAAVTYWERKKGIALHSPVLIADARHTFSDMIATLGVLATFIASKFNFFGLDRIVAFFIVILIGSVAISIFKRGTGVLIDHNRLNPKDVENVALTVQGVMDCHKIRSRGMEDWIALDFHILLDERLSLEEAHKITHQVERKVKNRFPNVRDVVIHTEPATAGRESYPWEKEA